MRRKTLAAALTLLALAGGVRSAQDELDADLMRSIEDANRGLASNIALKDGPGASADAKELGEMFVQVEGYFVRKGDAHDAVDLSKKSRELSAEILRLIADRNFDSATDAATSLSRTCKTCHNFYKKS